MKKITSYTAFFAILFSFTGINAQNTATQSGNWNNCATWGNPASIIQNATDTKTVNSGVTVTQNTAWSTKAITLNGNGAVTFASAANSVDFVTDGGADQSCCNVPAPAIYSQTQPTCDNGKKGIIHLYATGVDQYSKDNGATWSFSNQFTNLDPGTYYMKTKNSSIPNCESSTLTVVLNDPGSCACPSPSGLNVSRSASSIQGGQTASFSLTGGNISSATWSVSPSSGVSPSNGSGTNTGNITFLSPGDYTITFIASNTSGSCSTSTANAANSINVYCITPDVNISGPYYEIIPVGSNASFTATGTNIGSISWKLSRAGGVTIQTGGTNSTGSVFSSLPTGFYLLRFFAANLYNACGTVEDKVIEIK